MDMAYLILVGSSGWSQRWEITPGQEEAVSAQLDQVGNGSVGHLPLLDPESDSKSPSSSRGTAWQPLSSSPRPPSTGSPTASTRSRRS
jgi:hypothetical protein